MLFLNYAAVDPSLTNSKCSFWHFRFDADTSMKMEAMTTFMKDQTDVKKVYLINQNYSHGHQVAKYAKENLARKRPDVQIVGEDLTPLAQMRDFAPYIAKIKASGADTVITGNWGVRPDAAGQGGQRRRPERQVLHLLRAASAARPRRWAPTPPGASTRSGTCPTRPRPARKLMDEYKAKFNDDFYTAQIYNAYALLTAAMAKAKSTDPVKVAAAMEGLKVKSLNGDVEMRKTDHQLQQALYITRWAEGRPKPYDYSVENTGYNFRTVKTFEPYVVEHADLVPDEAPRRALTTPRHRPGPGELAAAGPFLSDDPRVDQFLINVLNGVSSGLLLFMLSSGLTLIFSMMGVLNFAHASFYMLGAYFAYSLSRAGRLLAGAGAGAAAGGRPRRAVRAHRLRRVHKFGHVPELLITFGLSYVILELVQLIWGRSSVNFAPPELLQGPAFTLMQSDADGLGLAWGAAPADAVRRRPTR